MWDKIKNFVFKYFGTIFLEEKENKTWCVSLGRVVLFALLGLCTYTWMIKSDNPPDSMIDILYVFIAYVFGTKVTDVVSALIAKKSGK